MRSILKTFNPYLRDTDKRALPPYQSFLQQQKKYTDIIFRITKNSLGHETKGMQQLRYILNFTDIDYLVNCEDNYKRYTDYLRLIYDSLISTFDRSGGGPAFTGYYVLNIGENFTKELIFPVSDDNCIIKLPFDCDNWEGWKYVKPLRMWTHNSDELATEMVNSYIRYRENVPDYAIFTIDVIALILKYVMWYKYQRSYETATLVVEESPQQYFIQRYVLSNLLYDITDVWLIRNFNTLLDLVSTDAVYERFKIDRIQTKPGTVSVNCYRGYEYLWNMQNQSKNTLRPEGLLSSKILLNTTLNQRIKYLNNIAELPDWGRFDWCRFVRDYDLIMLFLKLWYRRKDLPSANKIFIYTLYEIRNFIRMQSWKWCGDLVIRTETEQKAYELEILLDSYVRKK